MFEILSNNDKLLTAGSDLIINHYAEQLFPKCKPRPLGWGSGKAKILRGTNDLIIIYKNLKQKSTLNYNLKDSELHNASLKFVNNYFLNC